MKNNDTTPATAETAKVVFDRKKAKRLRKSYQDALKEDAESFEFDDHHYTTGFAGYLLEYLEQQLETDR